MSYSNPVGSVWGKWDLHVHTPCSLVQQYGGNNDRSWTAFIADLEKLPSEFKVIGVNDYLSFDGYERIFEAKRDQNRLANLELILPVVELRLDAFGGVLQKDKYGSYLKSDWNRVHLRILLDQLEPELIRRRFLDALTECYDLIPDVRHLAGQWQKAMTPDSVAKLGQMILDEAAKDRVGTYCSPLQEGFNHLCVSLESVRGALDRHGLAGRYLLAVGTTDWETLNWDDPSIADKGDAINRMDLVFTSAQSPQGYQASRRKLQDARIMDRLLDCSDAHALSQSKHNHDRIGNCFTWIKADPTFAGLKQAVTELDQRVFIGDHPPKRQLVSKNRTRYADAITIRKRAGSTLADPWFDIHLPLNHDLVAIIGNKGSGKSALADVIALAGDTRNAGGFSFLNERRFRDPKTKLAEHFSGSILWHDGTESHRALHQDPDPTSVERVKYLPQSYLESLCNELADTGSSTFDGELRKIIYSHVPAEERLGFATLDELLRFKVSELERERRLLTDQLARVNVELVAVERKMSGGYRQSLEHGLEARRRELLALESARPAPVEDPMESDSAREETAAATASIAELEQELVALRDEEQAARQRKADAVRGIAHISRILQAVRNYQTSHEQFILELESSLAELEVDLRASDLISLQVDTGAIEQIGEWFRTVSEDQDSLLQGEDEGSLLQRRNAVEARIEEITGQLGEKQRLFLQYKEQIAAWERSRLELLGDRDRSHTFAWYTAEIEALDALSARRAEVHASRIEILKRLYDQLGKLADEYRALYQPVRRFVQSTERMHMPLPLDFDVRIAEDGFLDGLLSRINRQLRSGASGQDAALRLVREALKETDFGDLESLIGFVEKIDDFLHDDGGSGAAEDPERSVPDQTKSGNSMEGLYDFLYGLEYLAPKYSLTYDGQEISLLSPGERGLLLLVFYLLVDKDDIPLVIDQPEENLDNQTIYKVLVTCIKMAKQRRQVIMVTHNPNLAVVCDAEQIIHASCDKANKRFTYLSGAIEAPAIKTRVVEILEGTEPAFVNRKQKYGY